MESYTAKPYKYENQASMTMNSPMPENQPASLYEQELMLLEKEIERANFQFDLLVKKINKVTAREDSIEDISKGIPVILPAIVLEDIHKQTSKISALADRILYIQERIVL